MSDPAGGSVHHSDYRISRPSSSEHRPSWISSKATSSRSAGHTKQYIDLSSTTADGGQFFSLIFDRQDYLLAIGDSEDEDTPDSEIEAMLDPRLLYEGRNRLAGSPMDTSAIHKLLSEKGEAIRSIHVTHLGSRQSVVNTIRVHPNLNLRNLFGNLPFSSSIKTNNYPDEVQNAQVNNLYLPIWAMMTVSTRPDPGSVRFAFLNIIQEATAMIESGTPVELIVEAHPNIGALFDESEFNKSGILSRWAAGMVHSTMLKGDDFTCFAYMHVFWYLMRWMISPSPETYELIPEWLRPTPNQLFMPHINTLDYIPWPAFRELAVQIPAMQQRMEWLIDMSNTMCCDWSSSTQEPLQRDEETGLIDVCVSAKDALRDLSNWSVGPTFRGYVSNADSYVRIRVEEF